jgi:hypothetical protein
MSDDVIEQVARVLFEWNHTLASWDDPDAVDDRRDYLAMAKYLADAGLLRDEGDYDQGFHEGYTRAEKAANDRFGQKREEEA